MMSFGQGEFSASAISGWAGNGRISAHTTWAFRPNAWVRLGSRPFGAPKFAAVAAPASAEAAIKAVTSCRARASAILGAKVREGVRYSAL